MPPSRRVRASLQRVFPAHLSNPFSLALRLIRTRSPDAIYALFNALLTAVAAPIDLALSAWERKAEQASPAPTQPTLIVCGPARSGTTLIYQFLTAVFPVAYVDNFTSLFPRSPIVARRLFRSRLRNDRVRLRSHYGRTARLWGTNDGLYFWDRWLGAERTKVTTTMTPEVGAAMRSFWGSYEKSFDAAVVTKANHVNAHAALVGSELPSAIFIIVHRESIHHAQSLLKARRHIHGRDDLPYGLADPDGDDTLSPYESVAHQIEYANRLADSAIAALGPDRVWVVSYDQFCANPRELLERVGSLIGSSPDRERVDELAAGLRASSRTSLAAAEYAQLVDAVARICRADRT